jgi:D-3-phosphoglycerate dehydrogenase / 2-oxoglutarate reductase
VKNVVISHRLHEDGMDVLKDKVHVIITNNGNPREIASELSKADGVIIRIGSIDREAILSSPNLRVIGRPGVGVDNIDMKTATEKGIPVVIAPGANTLSVAEHTVALIFAAVKDMRFSDSEMRKGNFAVRSSYRAFELSGKTLGLVGCGAIGREVARLCTCLGMNISVYDPFADPKSIEAAGYTYRDNLEVLLKESDVISIHTPLTDKTRGFIGSREFSLMKDGVILVNCARGEVVDEPALIKALHNKKVGIAALDVLSVEPVPKEHPLLSLENVIVTPHMAAQTKEAASRMATMAAEGVVAILNGEKWPHVANKDAYNHPSWQ